MIIDTHVHVIDKWRGYCGRGAVESDGFGRVRFSTGEVERVMPAAFTDSSYPVETQLEYMDEAGIDRAFLMQATFYGLLNDYVSRAVRQWPDRFVGCACVDPVAKYSGNILAHCVEDLGLRAVKFEMSEDYGLTGIHPDFRINGPTMAPFWDRLVGYGIPFMIDPGWSGQRGNHPEDVRQVATEHPELKIVVCHLGQPDRKLAERVCRQVAASPDFRPDDEVLREDSSWNEWMEVGRLPNVYFDLAILHTFARYEEYPYPTAQAYVRMAVERVGAGKLMWATDVPYALLMGSYAEALNWVRTHCAFLDEEARRGILGDTAARVLGFTTGTTPEHSQAQSAPSI
ncbi:MAG: amidohydrolase family protein [Candidatus Limnocylindrales bacterium]